MLSIKSAITRKNGSRLGSAAVDAQGRVTIVLAAPEDYGEVHDLYAVAVGKMWRAVASASFAAPTSLLPKVLWAHRLPSPSKGWGWRGFEQFMGVLYDNKYAGEISAVTTRGTAVFQSRAAGPNPASIPFNSTTALPMCLEPISTPSNRLKRIFTLISTTNKIFVSCLTLQRTLVRRPIPSSGLTATVSSGSTAMHRGRP